MHGFHCFDAVVWASETASCLYKLSDEVLAWLSVCREEQMICISSSSSLVSNPDCFNFSAAGVATVVEKRPLDGCVCACVE